MKTIKLAIPMIPPSLNRFAGRKNEWEYRQFKSEWKSMVSWYCPRHLTPPQRARVTIEYFFPTKGRRDPDNYAGKMILDGLTAAGAIPDDSFGCIELLLRGNYDREQPRTEITIEDITEE